MGGSTGGAEGRPTERCPAGQLWLPREAAEEAAEAFAGEERSWHPLPASLRHCQGLLGIYLLPRYPTLLPLTEHLRPCRSPSLGQTRSGSAGWSGRARLGSARRLPGHRGRGALTQRSGVSCRPPTWDRSLSHRPGAGGGSRPSSAPQPGAAGNGGAPHVTWARSRSSPGLGLL